MAVTENSIYVGSDLCMKSVMESVVAKVWDFLCPQMTLVRTVCLKTLKK